MRKISKKGERLGRETNKQEEWVKVKVQRAENRKRTQDKGKERQKEGEERV